MCAVQSGGGGSFVFLSDYTQKLFIACGGGGSGRDRANNPPTTFSPSASAAQPSGGSGKQACQRVRVTVCVAVRWLV